MQIISCYLTLTHNENQAYKYTKLYLSYSLNFITNK